MVMFYQMLSIRPIYLLYLHDLYHIPLFIDLKAHAVEHDHPDMFFITNIT